MSRPAELALAGTPSARETALWSGAAMVVLAAHLGIAAAYQWFAPRDPPIAMQEATVIELAPLPISLPEVVEADLAPESAASERVQADQDYAEAEPVEEADTAEEAVPETADLAETQEVEPVAEELPATADPVEEVAAADPVETVTPVADEPPAETVTETAEAEPDQPAEIVPEVAETTPPDTATPVEEIAEAEPVEQEVAAVDPDMVAPEIEHPVIPEVVMARPETAPRVEKVAEAKPVKKQVRREQPKREKPAPARKPRTEPRKTPVEKTAKAQTKKPAATKKAAAKPAKAKKEAGRVASKASAPKPKAAAVNPARWHGAVRAAVARRVGSVRGMRGTVRIAFVVSSSGAIVSARVAGSSGNAKLDQSALGMVRAARVPAPPAGLAGGRHSFTVPLSFR